MNQSETLLEIKDLCVEFKTMAGTVHAVVRHRRGKRKRKKCVLPGYDAADPKSSGQSHRRTDLI